MQAIDILQRVPLRRWKALKRWYRDNYAVHDWPDQPTYVTSGTLEGHERYLRSLHFEDASGWSVKYRGEVLNMRRPEGTDDQGRPVELHLRARPEPDGDGLEWNGHIEPSRWEEKTRHVESDDLEWLDRDDLERMLSPGKSF